MSIVTPCWLYFKMKGGSRIQCPSPPLDLFYMKGEPRVHYHPSLVLFLNEGGIPDPMSIPSPGSIRHERGIPYPLSPSKGWGPVVSFGKEIPVYQKRCSYLKEMGGPLIRKRCYCLSEKNVPIIRERSYHLSDTGIFEFEEISGLGF